MQEELLGPFLILRNRCPWVVKYHSRAIFSMADFAWSVLPFQVFFQRPTHARRDLVCLLLKCSFVLPRVLYSRLTECCIGISLGRSFAVAACPFHEQRPQIQDKKVRQKVALRNENETAFTYYEDMFCIYDCLFLQSELRRSMTISRQKHSLRLPFYDPMSRRPC